MRRAIVALTFLVLLGVSSGTAAAIQTAQFSITPGPGSRALDGTERLLVELKRATTKHTAVLVTNQLDTPIELRMDVVAMTVTPDGKTSLGGEDSPVNWVDLDRERVALEPHASAVVTASIHVPRHASERERSIGILAAPMTPDGEPAPSVVQRLALVVLIRPHGTASQPIVLIAIAVAIAIAVLGAVVWRAPALQPRSAR
jgi:hypothetical protein